MTRHASLKIVVLVCLATAAAAAASLPEAGYGARPATVGAFRVIRTAPLPEPQAAQAAKADPGQTVEGATNFVRLDANFASGGVTSPEAFAAIKQLGFRTVVNLRTSSEAGADIEGEAKTVERAGMKYVSLPFSPNAPDVTMIDKFLDLAKDAGSQPIYVHCLSGQRANAFWTIRRALSDGWTAEKTLAEADTLKVTNQRLREVVAAYVKEHSK